MKPLHLNKTWYIEVYTKEFGNVFLLDKRYTVPIPLTFDSEVSAMEYIKAIYTK